MQELFPYLHYTHACCVGNPGPSIVSIGELGKRLAYAGDAIVYHDYDTRLLLALKKRFHGGKDVLIFLNSTIRYTSVATAERRSSVFSRESWLRGTQN